MSLTREAKTKSTKPEENQKANIRWTRLAILGLTYESLEEEEKIPSLQGTPSSSVVVANQPAQF